MPDIFATDCILLNAQVDVGKFGISETKLDYWTPGSLMLADPGHFLYTMENYDKDNLTEEMINKLKVYIENPNFQPSKVRCRYFILAPATLRFAVEFIIFYIGNSLSWTDRSKYLFI